MNDVFSINNSALEELHNNELYKAQALFRENAKKNPCFITFHNLGLFYINEGLFDRYENRRKAKKIGINYLLKAMTYQKSYLTLFSLGSTYFENSDYIQAASYFRQACELRNDYAVIYNLALSLYRQGEYIESAEWYEKALHICDTDDYSEIYVSYSFALLHSDNKLCHKALRELIKMNDNNTLVERVIIAYFLGELSVARTQIQTMFNLWSVNVHEMAIVLDCLLKLGKDKEAIEYLKKESERFDESNYNIRSKNKQFMKLFAQEDYRKQVIESYKYLAPLIPQCCYYGCKLHNSQ
jgi:tetratricopeptide (TPR) repeat protein